MLASHVIVLFSIFDIIDNNLVFLIDNYLMFMSAKISVLMWSVICYDFDVIVCLRSFVGPD